MPEILLPRRFGPPIRGVPRLNREFEDIVAAVQVGGYVYTKASGWRYLGGTNQHKILPSRFGFALHTVGDNTPYFVTIDTPVNILSTTWGVVGRIHTPTLYNGATSLQVASASITVDSNVFRVSSGYFTPTDQGVDRTPQRGAYVACYSQREGQTAYLVDGAIKFAGAAPSVGASVGGITLGAYNNEAVRCWLGEMSLNFVLNVGDTVIARAFSAEPWQMFSEEPVRAYFFPSSGALTINSITASNITQTGATITLGLTR